MEEGDKEGRGGTKRGEEGQRGTRWTMRDRRTRMGKGEQGGEKNKEGSRRTRMGRGGQGGDED